MYIISRISSLHYLDDRPIESDEREESNEMFAKSKLELASFGLKGKTTDFSQLSHIESATVVNEYTEESISRKIKGYWEELVKKSPLSTS